MKYLQRLAAVFIVLLALLGSLIIYPFTALFYIITGEDVSFFSWRR